MGVKVVGDGGKLAGPLTPIGSYVTDLSWNTSVGHEALARTSPDDFPGKSSKDDIDDVHTSGKREDTTEIRRKVGYVPG